MIASARTVQPARMETASVGQNIKPNITLPEKMLRRIAKCRGTERSNCRGTAMYLVSEQRFDVGLDLHFFKDEYLSRMPPLTLPVQGCLVSWESYERVLHIGIVSSVEPLLVTHRLAWWSAFVENVPFSVIDQEMNELYAKYQEAGKNRGDKVVYYLPKILRD